MSTGFIMELNSQAIHDIVHPTAAFFQEASNYSDLPSTTQLDDQPLWGQSSINPKNRIDSLTPLSEPLWRIDGCAGLGTQFYLVPLFLGNAPPMRFDAFIPEEAAQHPLLRRLLGLDVVFHTKNAARVRRQGICTHILRSLQSWVINDLGIDSAISMYASLPFGSRIVFENLSLNVRDIRISVVPTYYLERQLLSAQKLCDLWAIPAADLPPTVDIMQLKILEQIHDSVCLTRFNEEPTNLGHHDKMSIASRGSDETWILKALTSNSRYLYHELRNLLIMPPHPNVVSKPAYLVTKRCHFGGKTAVVGFLEPFHSGGSLRDTLPLLRLNGRLKLEDQLKWAIQITTGLIHVRERGKRYYPDLRLDNIVVSSTGDAILVDFEQRGVWCEFSAPEINALEYVRILASDTPDSGTDDGDEIRARFADALARCLPDWEQLQAREEYTNPPEGYNIPWLCLLPREQEAAEVYMLGRVLWCLFEGMSAPQRGAVWQSYRWEPEIEFPDYHRTPQALRDLIDQCTSGRRGQLSAHIVRRGSKLALRDDPSPQDGSPQKREEIRRIARDWWLEEVKAAEDFITTRQASKSRESWNENFYIRPTLREVLAALEAFKVESL